MVRATQNILPAILAALIAALSMVSLNCVPSDGEDSTLNSGDPGSDYGGDDDAGDDDDTTADDDTGDDDVTVAVIYGSKPEAVSQFGGILASNGMTSYGVAESQVTAVTLDAADVIIVDRWTQWLAQAPALEVKNSGKPVLALGAGGLHLYDQLGMKSGFSNTNGFVYVESEIVVEAATHPIFEEPTDFSVINGDRVTLFSTVPELFAVDVTEPEGVSILATRPTDDLRATILLEDGRFMSWGFDFDVGFLNGNGTALLVNCVEFLASL